MVSRYRVDNRSTTYHKFYCNRGSVWSICVRSWADGGPRVADWGGGTERAGGGTAGGRACARARDARPGSARRRRPGRGSARDAAACRAAVMAAPRRARWPLHRPRLASSAQFTLFWGTTPSVTPPLDNILRAAPLHCRRCSARVRGRCRRPLALCFVEPAPSRTRPRLAPRARAPPPPALHDYT